MRAVSDEADLLVLPPPCALKLGHNS